MKTFFTTEAIFQGALSNAAKRLGTPVADSTVRALVSWLDDYLGGYRLGGELYAELTRLQYTQAQRLMEDAHQPRRYFPSPARRHFRKADGGLTAGHGARAARSSTRQ